MSDHDVLYGGIICVDVCNEDKDVVFRGRFSCIMFCVRCFAFYVVYDCYARW